MNPEIVLPADNCHGEAGGWSRPGLTLSSAPRPRAKARFCACPGAPDALSVPFGAATTGPAMTGSGAPPASAAPVRASASATRSMAGWLRPTLFTPNTMRIAPAGRSAEAQSGSHSSARSGSPPGTARYGRLIRTGGFET
ncbi:MAG: hypothetical protein ACLGIB_13220, partial [Actinomycetota bacterium]